MKIGFIGVGKLGNDVAEVISEKFDIVGYDIKKVHTAIKMEANIRDAVFDKDIVFCALPTPHHPDYDGRYPTSHLEPKNFDYQIVETSLKEINLHI